MSATQLRFVGVELYFGDLVRAKDFYTKVPRLSVVEEQPSHFAKLDFSSAFVCLERKGWVRELSVPGQGGPILRN